MKINRQFNTLSYSEYLHLLKNYSRFTDFNSLGLFRSILENEKLTLERKIEVRDKAIATFPRFFTFLQVKDPWTFERLKLLGQNFTVADERRLWNVIQLNQQKILADKRIRHRNFGTYSKHNCGYDTCHSNRLMIRQGSRLAESEMHFHTDKSHYPLQEKSQLRKRDRKIRGRIIAQRLSEE
jgi:hypothetical protein